MIVIIIIETKSYLKDYDKIINRKCLEKEKITIKKIELIIKNSKNMHELIIRNESKAYHIEQKKQNLKEFFTARINNNLRLIMKPVGEYPYNLIEIERIEFIKIDDKHYQR